MATYVDLGFLFPSEEGTLLRCSSMASSRRSASNFCTQRKTHLGFDVISLRDPSSLRHGSSDTEQTLETPALLRARPSWDAAIAGYVKQGKLQLAFSVYDERLRVSPADVGSHALFVLLKACCLRKDQRRGCGIHADAARRGILGNDELLDAALVDLYAKCGAFAKAREVLAASSARNSVMWTSLISGYAECSLGGAGLRCFEEMKRDGMRLDSVAFVCALKARGCTESSSRELQEMHASVIIYGFDGNIAIGSALIDAYAKCRFLEEAQDVFDHMSTRDTVTWTALISGYSECGYGEKALGRYEEMREDGVSPSLVTFLCSLKACASAGSVGKGQTMHSEIAKQGLESELFIGSSLIDMYAKCRLLDEAQGVFDGLPPPNRNTVAWTALLTGYAEHGCDDRAIKCFEKLQREGQAAPNAATFVSILKACGSIGEMAKGQEVHAEAERRGLVENDVFVGSILVDMYAKCGDVAKAQEVFDNMSEQNTILWTSLMAGYASRGCGEEAMACLERMQEEGFCPSAASYVCGLKACGSSRGVIRRGYEMHSEIVAKSLEAQLLVGNALVDMYAKCGSLTEAALYVFGKLPLRDVFTWTALITGFAQRGESQEVFRLFDEMMEDGVKPNLVTLGSLLAACSHSGLTENGQMYLESIGDGHDLVPTLEHYTCIVDLLARAGHIDKAISVVRKMPIHPGLATWQSVLGACQKWGNVELARYAFEQAIRINAKDPAAYVCMSNIYTRAAMLEEAAKVEALRIASHAWMREGQSWWRDGCGILHFFPDSDDFRPCRKLSDLRDSGKCRGKQAGIGAMTVLALGPGSVDVENGLVCTHSEKLAVAYALINTPKGTPIHVGKNTPMCSDCRLAIAHTSRMEHRRIVVDDGFHTHVFFL